MHADQVDITEAAVRRLVAEQFPQWRDLPVQAVASHGTVNALFRLGAQIVLRFPLQPGRDPGLRDELRGEQDLARRLGAHLRSAGVPLAVPEPVALGEPGDGYPGPWTAYRWIPGESASGERLGDPVLFARDLAEFVRAVHGMDTAGRAWSGTGRGGPLPALDGAVRDALARSTRLTDTVRLTQVWERCLAAPRDAPDVWVHGDLMPGNLLVRGGRLAAVIDLEGMGVGDPAVDLMPAWNLLATGTREAYRDALRVSEATWERGRGWALVQAIVALPYYVQSNTVMTETAQRTLAALLE
jgi:aminoglycoside phosphotransferase (APT) family kinase protein